MYRELWIVMLSVGVLLLIVSLMLFFIWGIPELIDELTGRKAKRQIKIMHDINLNTGVFDKYSTSDIYCGIPSGSLVSEDIGSIGSDLSEIKEVVTGSVKDDSTSYMEIEEATTYVDEEATSYVGEEDPSTSYLEGAITIKILEEQSSL